MVVNIESVPAMENLDDILKVEGLDAGMAVKKGGSTDLAKFSMFGSSRAHALTPAPHLCVPFWRGGKSSDWAT